MIPQTNIRTRHCTQSCSHIICGYRWKTACTNRRYCSPGGFPVSICLNKSLGSKHKDISNWAMLKRCQEKVLSSPILNMFPKIQELIEESYYIRATYLCNELIFSITLVAASHYELPLCSSGFGITCEMTRNSKKLNTI